MAAVSESSNPPTGPVAREPEQTQEAALRVAVEEGFPAAVGTLGRLVRIPSVSFPGFDPDAVRRSADAVAELARGLDVFDEVDVLRVGDGAPAVVARRAASDGRPTVLLYAHHDVQPPGPDEAWSTPPFEPTLVAGRLRGRGASDDKSGVVTHLAAVRAFADVVGTDSGLGIALFIEGEEEAGSPSFDAFLAAHRERLRADVIVVADSDNPSTSVPGITATLRGNVAFTLRVSTLASPSHSGMFGGAAPDAMLAAIVLLGTLWSADGSVAVAGLEAEPTEPRTDADDAAFAADAELLPGVSPIGAGSVHDRLWRGPAITITGIDAPDVRNASNTLSAEVRVKVSVRVQPGLSAATAYAAVRAHLEASAPFGAHLEFADVELGEGFLVDTSGWAVRDAADALEAGWGAAPVFTGVGGSIPFVATLADTYPDAQILVTGVEDPASKAHAPDESQSLAVLQHAILSEALLLLAASRRTLGA